MSQKPKRQRAGPILENRILRDLVGSFARHPRQINGLLESDAELLPLDGRRILALTTDTMVEEIRSGLYADPFLIGWMSVMINLSDLAAVGARPLGLTLIQHLPEGLSESFVRSLQSGVQAACVESQTYILGGDTNRSDQLQMGAAAIGLIEDGRTIMRKGCRPLDKLYATGAFGLGNAYAYARLFSPGESAAVPFRPHARWKEGQLIRRYGSACIDTSDGFLQAVANLIEQNQTGFAVARSAASVLAGEWQGYAKAAGIPEWVFLAAPHGEFELLFTIPANQEAAFLAEARSKSWEPMPLGWVVDPPGLYFREEDAFRAVPLFEIVDLFTESGGKPDIYLEKLLETKFYEAEEWVFGHEAGGKGLGASQL